MLGVLRVRQSKVNLRKPNYGIELASALRPDASEMPRLWIAKNGVISRLNVRPNSEQRAYPSAL